MPSDPPQSSLESGDAPRDLSARGLERKAVLAGALAEVDEEVVLRRAAGALPLGFEEQLEKTFEELSPTEGSGHLMRLTLEIVDRNSAFDPQVPVGSRRPGGAFFKRLVRAAVGWYVRFFVSQITRFALSVRRALHVVAEDVEHLQEEVAAIRRSVPDDVVVPVSFGERWWMPLASSALSGVSGRVLCGDVGATTTVSALRNAGVDAYAFDAYGARAATEPHSGMDVRSEALVDHVRALLEGSIAGAVLEGSVQWLGPRGCEELVSLLASRLQNGGVLLVASLTSEAWARAADPVVCDLAPGRPLHPETWAYLLGRHGFAANRVHRGGTDLLSQVRSVPAGSSLENEALLSAIGSLVAGPDEYVVIASREMEPQ